MNSLELEYERNIAPQLDVITQKCKDAGIPMFATVQITPCEFKTFCCNEEKSNWFKIKMMTYIDKTWSFDEFLDVLLEDALRNGHSSQYMEAMGIPKSPNSNQPLQERILKIRNIVAKVNDR